MTQAQFSFLVKDLCLQNLLSTPFVASQYLTDFDSNYAHTHKIGSYDSVLLHHYYFNFLSTSDGWCVKAKLFVITGYLLP